MGISSLTKHHLSSIEDQPGEKVIVEGLHSGLDLILGPLGAVLVELHDAEGGEDPGAGRRQDVVVAMGHPLDHLDNRGVSITVTTRIN